MARRPYKLLVGLTADLCDQWRCHSGGQRSFGMGSGIKGIHKPLCRLPSLVDMPAPFSNISPVGITDIIELAEGTGLLRDWISKKLTQSERSMSA